MSTSYGIWLCTDRGERLHFFGTDFESAEYTRLVNGAGLLHSFTAVATNLAHDLIQVDRQLQFWRKVENQDTYLDFVCFIRYWRWELTQGGVERLVIEDAYDQNEFLDRRIVAYAAGNVFAVSAGQAADDAMKSIFSENFLATATDADREIQDNSVTVEANLTAGPVIDKGYAHERVLPLLLEINQQTRQEGNEVFFDLAINDVNWYTGQLSYEFRTYTEQPGARKTWETNNPIIFGKAFGNLLEAAWEFDYRGEENAVYVGGQGVEAYRTIVEVEDTDRQGSSIWNRREGWVDARDVENTTQTASTGRNGLLGDRGLQRLNETRPKSRLSGRIRSTGYTLYGKDWTLGDRVTVNAFGTQVNSLIVLVNVRIVAGVEVVTGLIETVESDSAAVPKRS